MKCPMCGAGAYRREWNLPDRMHPLPGVFAVRICASCQSSYLPDPPDDLDRYYPETYYSFGSVVDNPLAPVAVADHTRGTTMLRKVLSPVVHYLRDIDLQLAQTPPCPGAAVLDVGCGSGHALDLYAHHGWETWGVEPGVSGAEQAAKKQHRVVQGDFLDADLPGRAFRVVRFRHSIEHLRDPAAAIAKAAGLLQPGGVLLIEVPNVGGWLARVAGGAYWQLDPPRHLAIPHPRRLGQVLRQAGFDDVAMTTYSGGYGLAVSIYLHRASPPAGGAEDGPGRPLITSLPTGYRVLRLLLHPVAILTDLVRRGDNLRVVARYGTAPPGHPAEPSSVR